MSTPAAIVLASGAVAFALWFLGLTRNGHRVVYVTLVAIHRLIVPATGQHGLDQCAGMRDLLRALASASLEWVTVRWWQLRRSFNPKTRDAARAWADIRLRGCAAHPETLRSRAAAWEPEEVPALEPLQGRAPGTHPDPLRETAAQPRLDEPANPARGYAPPAGWTPYVPAPIGAPE